MKPRRRAAGIRARKARFRAFRVIGPGRDLVPGPPPWRPEPESLVAAVQGGDWG